MSNDLFVALAAIASATAAIASLFVAWKAPKSAAALAEKLRSESEQSSGRNPTLGTRA